jgi:hypothetical protein
MGGTLRASEAVAYANQVRRLGLSTLADFLEEVAADAIRTPPISPTEIVEVRVEFVGGELRHSALVCGNLARRLIAECLAGLDGDARAKELARLTGGALLRRL